MACFASANGARAVVVRKPGAKAQANSQARSNRGAELHAVYAGQRGGHFKYAEFQGSERGIVEVTRSTRGKVAEFTGASRRRLMHKFAGVDWQGADERGLHCLFITLTMPPRYWQALDVVKRALAAFRRRLFRKYGATGAFVKREYGAKRGALHYHLLLLGHIDFIDADWLREAWTRAFARGLMPPEPGQLFRVDIEKPKSAQHVARYLAKYVAKVGYEGAPAARGGGAPPDLALSKGHNRPNDSHAERGVESGTRFWYIWRPDLIPWGDEVLIDETPQRVRKVSAVVRRRFISWQRAHARRTVERICGQLEEKYPGTVFSADFKQWKSKQVFAKGYGAKVKKTGSFNIIWDPRLIEACVFHALDLLWQSEEDPLPF